MHLDLSIFTFGVPIGLLCVFGLTGCHWDRGTNLSFNVTPAYPPLFLVKKDGKQGYIDAQSKLAIPFQFDAANDFSEGLASVCIGPCKFVKDDPKADVSFEQTFQGTYGYINSDGKMVINPHFTSAGDFHHGLAYASTDIFKLNGTPMKFGYIDKSGIFVIQPQFDGARAFDESGIAVACIGGGEESRCGFIDAKGAFVINPQFYGLQDFRGGLAWALEKKGMTPSYINRSGQVVWKGEPDWQPAN